jgi:SAM-dependent methyltransferase
MNEGFVEGYYEKLAQVEGEHFWFNSRNRLVTWALNKYFPDVKSFLEVGCGTGFVLSEIERSFPQLRLWGGEIHPAGLKCASPRLTNAKLMQMDARKIPFENEIDVIGAFDVLEHVDDDELVLAQINKALHKGGGIILTVPQHPFLWSSWDVTSCHRRRYTRKELVTKLDRAGFKVVRITSFFFFIFPLMMLSRIKMSLGPAEKKSNLEAAFSISPVLSTSLEKICKVERSLIARGISFPAGGSLLCVGTKK